jgi:hypothetical protein
VVCCFLKCRHVDTVFAWFSANLVDNSIFLNYWIETFFNEAKDLPFSLIKEKCLEVLLD